jgi:hypothetical protein
MPLSCLIALTLAFQVKGDELASPKSGGYITVSQCQKHLETFGCTQFFQESNTPVEYRLTCSASQGLSIDAKEFLAQEILSLKTCAVGGGEATWDLVSLLWKIPIGAYDLIKQGAKANAEFNAKEAAKDAILEKYYDECGKSEDCRIETLVAASEGRHTAKDYQHFRGPAISGANLNHFVKVAQYSANKRKISENSEKIRQVIFSEPDSPARDQKIRDINPQWKSSDEATHESKALAALLQDFFKKQGQKLMCYSKPARQEMICYGLASLFAPGAALKMAEKSKLLLATKKGAEILKTDQQVTRIETAAPREAVVSNALEKFPNLSNRLRSLEGQTPKEASILKAKQIPFYDSRKFRAISDEEMLKRSEQLSPVIEKSIVSVYNTLGNQALTETYFKKLFSDSAAHMARRGKPGDLKLLAEGKIDPDVIAAILVKRAKARGDTQFTNLTRDELKVGKLVTESDAIRAPNFKQYEAFRQAIKGPFFDSALSSNYRAAHGSLSHLVQRDMVYDAVVSSTNGQPQVFWNFLGSKKGVHWWVDLFDSGSTASFRKPEHVQKFIYHELGGAM